MIAGAAKRALKALRSSQPFNRVSTSVARLVFRGLGWTPEAVIKHLHRVGGVHCPLPNGATLRLWSRGDDWVSNQVFWRGWLGYEPESVRAFYCLAAASAVTFDVGSHVGFYTLVAAHANPQAQVFAFEPLPAVFERLTHHVALNRLANVRCVRAAASDRDGQADFYHVPAGLPTSSSLSFDFMDRSLQHAPAGQGRLTKVTVPTITLDRFVEEHGLGRVGLVKVDVEGTEPAVLRGMTAVLGRDRPNIVCEVLPGSGTGEALEDVLRPLGYRFFHLTAQGPIPKERIEGQPTSADELDGHKAWLNYLFSPMAPGDVAAVVRAP